MKAMLRAQDLCRWRCRRHCSGEGAAARLVPVVCNSAVDQNVITGSLAPLKLGDEALKRGPRGPIHGEFLSIRRGDLNEVGVSQGFAPGAPVEP